MVEHDFMCRLRVLSGLLGGLDIYANALSRTLTCSWPYLPWFVKGLMLPCKTVVDRVK